MINNRSPHPKPSRSQQLDPGADVLAVLDGADVSEPVRAAVEHALNAPPAPNPRPTHRSWPETDALVPYTLHLTFPATDLDDARSHAITYVEGLSLLRPELGIHPPSLSRADSWSQHEPLYCGAVGPDAEICADVRNHPGFHRAAGLGGLCWGGGVDY
ncbi:hypothetical protein AB0J86_02835 [Micromonospora sp. NPDC049559]|uniref:hypothetical protein n=1 Tax=Micromonospora sp. NPDC049559 TaxID=3155923 RepID=UPI0034284175